MMKKNESNSPKFELDWMEKYVFGSHRDHVMFCFCNEVGKTQHVTQRLGNKHRRD